MSLTLSAPDGVPEIRAGDDLAAHLLDALGAAGRPLADGDVVLVTSKAVGKAEDRARAGPRTDSLAVETVRVVARRGPLAIVRTRHGLVLAAAGIDASNVEAGHHLLLPEDPDGSARRLRADLFARTGRNVAVVVTDTAGRAWRTGQTDIAVGAAGLVVSESYAGQSDAHGNPLLVTEPALADELAGAAELVQGKLSGRPFAVARGRSDAVLPPGDDGPGAAALVRPEGQDLFGLGAREAVVAAVSGREATAFGAPVGTGELAGVLTRAFGATARLEPRDDGSLHVQGPPAALVVVVAFAHGWRALDAPASAPPPTARADAVVILRPVVPTP